MPITYSVSYDGHFIHAVASDVVTAEEFVQYVVAHSIDERIKPPVSELLEIELGALRKITMEEMSKVLELRKKAKKRPKPHRCAIVVSLDDNHAWNLSKFAIPMAAKNGLIKLSPTWAIMCPTLLLLNAATVLLV